MAIKFNIMQIAELVGCQFDAAKHCIERCTEIIYNDIKTMNKNFVDYSN